LAALIDNAGYWKLRAEQTRVVAESIQDDEVRERMLGVVKDYERMAESAEDRTEKEIGKGYIKNNLYFKVDACKQSSRF
jgi:hypothetical protein